jgi:hypothetical protein
MAPVNVSAPLWCHHSVVLPAHAVHTHARTHARTHTSTHTHPLAADDGCQVLKHGRPQQAEAVAVAQQHHLRW